MNLKFSLAALGLLAGVCDLSHAQDASPAPAPTAAVPAEVTPASELKELVARVSAKLRAGQRKPADLAGELAEFDALMVKYAADKSDDVAQILFMKAALYSQVLEDPATGTELFKKVIADYPGSKIATNAERTMVQMERAAKARQTQAGLIGKAAPNLNFTWRSDEGPKTLAEYKGKVVVLDFWATWCGPCIASFPKIQELIEHYKESEVVVIGVTSLQGFVAGLEGGRIDTKGNPEKEMALMNDFMKAKSMTWTVAFSQEEVFNPDYGVTGIPYVAIIAPDGTVRHAGLHPGNPLAEKAEKIDAILKEFNLKVPAAPAKTS